MIKTYLPWLLSVITIYMTLLAGNRHPMAWMVGLLNQALWLVWTVDTSAWGLVPMNVALWVVYARNHLAWNRKSGTAAALDAAGDRVMNDQVTEEKPTSAAPTGPRVTPMDVEHAIVSEFYFTAGDGVRGESQLGTSPAGRAAGLERITFCILVMRNGHQIVGVNEGPVSPENFCAKAGREFARKHAESQVWSLLGYELRSRLNDVKNLATG